MPLVPFSEFQEGFDEGVHRAGLEFLNQNPELVNKIRFDLGGHSLTWRLDGLSHRTLYVPEQRELYAKMGDRMGVIV